MLDSYLYKTVSDGTVCSNNIYTYDGGSRSIVHISLIDTRVWVRNHWESFVPRDQSSQVPRFGATSLENSISQHHGP